MPKLVWPIEYQQYFISVFILDCLGIPGDTDEWKKSIKWLVLSRWVNAFNPIDSGLTPHGMKWGSSEFSFWQKKMA